MKHVVLPGGYEQLWTMRELCIYLRCGRTHAYTLIDRYGLPYCKITIGRNSGIRFRAEEVREWVVQHEIPHIEDEQLEMEAV